MCALSRSLAGGSLLIGVTCGYREVAVPPATLEQADETTSGRSDRDPGRVREPAGVRVHGQRRRGRGRLERGTSAPGQGGRDWVRTAGPELAVVRLSGKLHHGRLQVQVRGAARGRWLAGLHCQRGRRLLAAAAGDRGWAAIGDRPGLPGRWLLRRGRGTGYCERRPGARRDPGARRLGHDTLAAWPAFPPGPRLGHGRPRPVLS